MTKKEYVCAYKHCLHPGQPVAKEQSVVIGKRHYHWDCASLKNEIQDCAQSYVELINDKTKYPVALKIINVMVFKNMVPIDYIRRNINNSKMYYKDKPVYVLYGIRKLFWEKEMKNVGGD